MNQLSTEKQLYIHLLFSSGASLRAVMRLTGIAKNTAARYRAMALIRPCACGKPSTHNGWCSYRFARSRARQETMTLMHVRAALRSRPELFGLAGIALNMESWPNGKAAPC